MQKNSQEQCEEFTTVSSKSRADMKTTALDDDTKGTLESNITDTKSELRSAQPSATTVSLDLSGYSATTVKEILELIKDLLPEVISEGLAKSRCPWILGNARRHESSARSSRGGLLEFGYACVRSDELLPD